MTTALDFLPLHGDLYVKAFKKEMTIPEFVSKHKLYFSKGVIKDPGLTYYCGELRAFFPHGRFVFIIRDPRENIRSILNRLNIPGKFDELSKEITDNLPGHKMWRDYVEGTIPRVGGNNYIEKLASQWNRVADIYTKHAETLTLIRYEDFVKDKIGSLVSLANSVGLGYKHNIDHLLDVQFQPKGDHSLSWLEFYGKDNLCRIETICGNHMRRFGYAL